MILRIIYVFQEFASYVGTKNLIIVGGSVNWSEFFPEYSVNHIRIDHSRWFTNGNKLMIFANGERLMVDGVMWRIGAIKPRSHHRTILEMIDMTNTPCLNSSNSLLKTYDRISMLKHLKMVDVPVINFEVITGVNALWGIHPKFPVVAKFGNYHGGYGKSLIKDASEWADLKDMAFLIDDYCTVEEYIDYSRDVRILIVGDSFFATEREGMFWKVNHMTTHVREIDPPQELVEIAIKVKKYLGSDVLGLDFLQRSDNDDYVLLEVNDIPGIKEYDVSVKQKIANLMIERMKLI